MWEPWGVWGHGEARRYDSSDSPPQRGETQLLFSAHSITPVTPYQQLPQQALMSAAIKGCLGQRQQGLILRACMQNGTKRLFFFLGGCDIWSQTSYTCIWQIDTLVSFTFLFCWRHQHGVVLFSVLCWYGQHRSEWAERHCGGRGQWGCEPAVESVVSYEVVPAVFIDTLALQCFFCWLCSDSRVSAYVLKFKKSLHAPQRRLFLFCFFAHWQLIVSLYCVKSWLLTQICCLVLSFIFMLSS